MGEKLMGEVPTKSKEQAEQELKRLREWVKKIIPDDYDKYDIAAKFDSSLTYEENKSAIRDDLKSWISDMKNQSVEAEKERVKDAKNAAERAKVEQAKLEEERKLAAEREVEEYNKGRVYADSKDIDTYYAPIIRAVNKMCQGYSNLLFVKGRGGIGKSYQIRKALLSNGYLPRESSGNIQKQFVEVCGEVTEAYLYRLLFENNGAIIWCKDVVKLLSNQGSLNLLKSACETESQRVLTKNNYSKDQDDLPNMFVCRCRFIFDYNNLFGASLKDDFEALTTRGDFIQLPMSNEDVENILTKIAEGDEIKQKVTAKIVEQAKANGLVKLNLRTQWKAMQTYEYCKKNNLDWEKEISDELKNVSKTRAMLYTLIGTRVVKTTELKKLMLKNELVSCIRTADRKINEYLFLEELYKWSAEERDFFVGINPKKV